MSLDEYTALVQLNTAQQMAFTAEQGAARAAREAHDAQMAAGAAFQRVQELEGRNARMRRELTEMQAHTLEAALATARSAFVQEAATMVPFLRNEIKENFDERAQCRAVAEKWINDGSISEDDYSTILKMVGDGTRDSQYWLPYAIAASMAATKNENELYKTYFELSLRKNAVLASGWAFYAAMKEENQARMAAAFTVLCSKINVRSVLPDPIVTALYESGRDNYGDVCKSEVVGLVQKWHDQVNSRLDSDPSLAELKEQTMSGMFPLAAARDVFDPICGDGARGKYILTEFSQYAERYIQAERKLNGVETALNAEAKRIEKAFSFAKVGKIYLSRIAKLQDSDEAADRAKLALYLSATKTGGDGNASSEAHTKVFLESRGNWHAMTSCVVGMCQYEMRNEILRICRDWICEYVAATPESDDFGPVPNIYGERAKTAVDFYTKEGNGPSYQINFRNSEEWKRMLVASHKKNYIPVLIKSLIVGAVIWVLRISVLWPMFPRYAPNSILFWTGVCAVIGLYLERKRPSKPVSVPPFKLDGQGLENAKAEDNARTELQIGTTKISNYKRLLLKRIEAL